MVLGVEVVVPPPISQISVSTGDVPDESIVYIVWLTAVPVEANLVTLPDAETAAVTVEATVVVLIVISVPAEAVPEVSMRWLQYKVVERLELMMQDFVLLTTSASVKVAGTCDAVADSVTVLCVDVVLDRLITVPWIVEFFEKTCQRDPAANTRKFPTSTVVVALVPAVSDVPDTVTGRETNAVLLAPIVMITDPDPGSIRHTAIDATETDRGEPIVTVFVEIVIENAALTVEDRRKHTTKLLLTAMMSPKSFHAPARVACAGDPLTVTASVEESIDNVHASNAVVPLQDTTSTWFVADFIAMNALVSSDARTKAGALHPLVDLRCTRA